MTDVRTIALKIHSPLVKAGLMSLIGSMKDVGVEEVTYDLLTIKPADADLLIIESIDVPGLHESIDRTGVPVVAVMTTALPDGMTTSLAGKIGLYDTADTVRGLLTEPHARREQDAVILAERFLVATREGCDNGNRQRFVQ